MQLSVSRNRKLIHSHPAVRAKLHFLEPDGNPKVLNWRSMVV